MVTEVRMRWPPLPTQDSADGHGGRVGVERAQDGRGRADHSEDPHHRREWGGQVQVRRCVAGPRPLGCGLPSRNGRRGPAGSALAGRAQCRPRSRVSYYWASGLGPEAAVATRAQPACLPLESSRSVHL